MHTKTSAPVIAIDGPSGSGKGTVAALVAARLGWNYLDSGALYRLTALAAIQAGIDLADEAGVSKIAAELDVEFVGQTIMMKGVEVTESIRAENIGEGASIVAKLPAVRTALLQRQRDFATLPGLVTDGRDMCSEIFPEADVKIYLTASVEVRAKRRYKQLTAKGVPADYEEIYAGIEQRDLRDSSRTIAPLKRREDTHLLDTSELTIDEAVETVLRWWEEAAR